MCSNNVICLVLIFLLSKLQIMLRINWQVLLLLMKLSISEVDRYTKTLEMECNTKHDQFHLTVANLSH